jgi:hypothetical protein
MHQGILTGTLTFPSSYVSEQTQSLLKLLLEREKPKRLADAKVSEEESDGDEEQRKNERKIKPNEKKRNEIKQEKKEVNKGEENVKKGKEVCC